MSPGPVTDGTSILAAPTQAAPDADTEGVTATTAPGGIDLSAVAADLRDGHVYSQDPAQVPALEQVVAHTQSQGHDINIVVLSQQMPKFTMYRDMATELQQQVHGTVLVFGPNNVGSASPEFSRATLEDATDHLTLSNPPQAAQQMVDAITEPGLDWTLITIVLIVVVAFGAVVGRVRSLRRRRSADSDPAASDPAPSQPAASHASAAQSDTATTPSSGRGDAATADDSPVRAARPDA